MQQSRSVLLQEIEELKLTLAKLLEWRYGRRSERVLDDPNQQKLDFGDEPEVQDALAEAAAEAEQFVEGYTRKKKDKKRRPGSEKFPEHLERYEVTAPGSKELKNCPRHGERQLIGYDRTETLLPTVRCSSENACPSKSGL